MKYKNKSIVISIISTLLMVSTISIFFSAISRHNNFYNKNFASVKIKNHENIVKSHSNYNEGLSTLINNLTYVEKYIGESVISKQDTLKYSVLGCHTKGEKHYKISEIGWLNKHSTIKKNRYSHQVYATITNSHTSLESEDTKIKDIIVILKNHPYTYQQYLNIKKYIIPNISFFIRRNNSKNLYNLKSESKCISSNSYYVNHVSPNLSNISSQTEEETIGAKSVSLLGSSITKTVFNQISFAAKIITFNPLSNSYQFAIPTSILSNKKTIKTNLYKENILNMENTEISRLNSKSSNNSFRPNSKVYLLSNILSHNYNYIMSLSSISNNSYFPNYFNKYKYYLGHAQIKYDQITQFKYNKSLYSVVITLVTIFNIIPTIVYITVSLPIVINDLRKKRVRLRVMSGEKNINIVYEAEKAFIEDQAYYLTKVHLNRIAQEINMLGVRYKLSNISDEDLIIKNECEAHISKLARVIDDYNLTISKYGTSISTQYRKQSEAAGLILKGRLNKTTRELNLAMSGIIPPAEVEENYITPEAFARKATQNYNPNFSPYDKVKFPFHKEYKPKSKNIKVRGRLDTEKHGLEGICTGKDINKFLSREHDAISPTEWIKNRFDETFDSLMSNLSQGIHNFDIIHVMRS